MQIAVISRKDGRQYWVSVYYSITYKYEKALKTDDVKVVAELVKKYYRLFKILIVTDEGELIRKYE